jgi:hypothetical protein
MSHHRRPPRPGRMLTTAVLKRRKQMLRPVPHRQARRPNRPMSTRRSTPQPIRHRVHRMQACKRRARSSRSPLPPRPLPRHP